jgi:hypothetical protein
MVRRILRRQGLHLVAKLRASAISSQSMGEMDSIDARILR